MKNKILLSIFVLGCINPNTFGQWMQVGNDIDGKRDGDEFGTMVSLSADGKIVAITAPFSRAAIANSGKVEVYKENNGIWTQLGNAINGPFLSQLSISLSEDGLRLAIGAPINLGNIGSPGIVRVFSFINNTWLQIGADLIGNYGNKLGTSVALSANGERLVVGAVNSIGNGLGNGFARVYEERNGFYLPVGQDVMATQLDDRFGHSVSISSNGKRIAVGAPNNDSITYNAGYLKIYDEILGQWIQVKNTISGEGLSDMAGFTVALSGDGNKVATAALGWIGLGHVVTHVRTYQETNLGWVQLGGTLDGLFDAMALSKDGNVVATEVRTNKSKVYGLSGNNWLPINPEIICETINEIYLSISLSFNGNRIAIGSKYNSGAGDEAGHVRVFEKVPCQDSDLDQHNAVICGGDDCNDGNPAIHPGAIELCNGIDDDCDGQNDEGFPDVDHDGFPDCRDACPTDPNKTQPLFCGCNIPETDTDGDGFPDCIDNCDTDPNKSQPEFCGCNSAELDTDGDGFPDCIDECDLDLNKFQPELCGCNNPETDTDADGFPDCRDGCDNDPNKILPGFCGCGISDDADKDLDGMPDCRDRCPSDPNRVNDVDADGDGVLDCNELCKLNAGKISPGVCGCDVPDIDSDGDGIMDCIDQCPGIRDDVSDNDNDGKINCADGCPDDSIKQEPGLCGCGIGDVDSDRDGVLDCNDNCLLNSNSDQADADCDGVGDPCDLCKGGNDKIDLDNDGRPDCWFLPNYNQINITWKCQEGMRPTTNVLVSVLKNGTCETKCVTLKKARKLLITSQLYHFGPCNNSNCNP